MKPKVNKDICIGCGACQAIAEKVFEVGNDGLAEAIVDVIPEEEKENAIDAKESCPTGAISIE